MKESTSIICLVKFGKHEHLQKMLKMGELYFNDPNCYNKWQDKEEQSGDKNEGAEWIENAYLTKLEISHPIYGRMKLRPSPNTLAKIIQYNYFFLSHSLYALTTEAFKSQDTFRIDARNAQLKDADSAILIQEPYRFINAVVACLKSESLNYETKLVEYKDLDREGKISMNPFIKKLDHKHQSEFRMIIENTENHPRTIKIGSIEPYSKLISSKSMTEIIWRVARNS